MRQAYPRDPSVRVLEMVHARVYPVTTARSMMVLSKG